MVGHMLDIIMPLIAGPTTRWDVPLQGKKMLIVQIPSSLNMWMKIPFPQAKLELQDYAQKSVHTNELPNWSLPSAQWGDLTVSCRQWERGAGGWPWDYCSSYNANMAQPAAFLAPWPTGLSAHITLYCLQSFPYSHSSRIAIKVACPKYVPFGFCTSSSWGMNLQITNNLEILVVGRIVMLAFDESHVIWGKILA